MTERFRAAEFWDREIEERSHVTWMSPLTVRLYINTMISGDPNVWTLEWFERAFAGRLPIRRALSIGCGTGVLERVLVQRKIVTTVDAFDGSLSSLAEAKKTAEREGLTGIRYFAGDFNQPALPRDTYDAVFFHQSAHHVAHLERLFRAVLRAMTRDAIVFLDEYVGPSRIDWLWDAQLIAPQRRAFAALPTNARRKESLALPIQEDDPSEAIRSSEILPQLRVGFDVIAQRDYGGNLLSVLYPYLRADDALLGQLIEEERALLASGAPSYHTVVVATPKPNRLASRMRYWLAPKLRGARFAFITRVLRRRARW